MAIQYEEMKEYSEKHADLKWRGYSFRIDQERLLGLFVGPDAYTLAWNGRIDFSKVDTEALFSLPVQLFGQPVSSGDEIAVSLIFSGPRDTLIKYALSDPGEFSKYKIDVQRHRHLLFARYDVNWLRSPEPPPTRPGQPIRSGDVGGLSKVSQSYTYSLIAENAEPPPQPQPAAVTDFGSYNELAVKLPRKHHFNRPLLPWIIERHNDAGVQRGFRDDPKSLDYCTEVIIKLTN